VLEISDPSVVSVRVVRFISLKEFEMPDQSNVEFLLFDLSVVSVRVVRFISLKEFEMPDQYNVEFLVFDLSVVRPICSKSSRCPTTTLC
jgi:hypothetical protein